MLINFSAIDTFFLTSRHSLSAEQLFPHMQSVQQQVVVLLPMYCSYPWADTEKDDNVNNETVTGITQLLSGNSVTRDKV